MLAVTSRIKQFIYEYFRNRMPEFGLSIDITDYREYDKSIDNYYIEIKASLEIQPYSGGRDLVGVPCYLQGKIINDYSILNSESSFNTLMEIYCENLYVELSSYKRTMYESNIKVEPIIPASSFMLKETNIKISGKRKIVIR